MLNHHENGITYATSSPRSSITDRSKAVVFILVQVLVIV